MEHKHGELAARHGGGREDGFLTSRAEASPARRSDACQPHAASPAVAMALAREWK